MHFDTITSTDSRLLPEQYPRLDLVDWNGNLQCRSFSILAENAPGKYRLGDRWRIQDKQVDRFMGLADIVSIRTLQYHEITDEIAWLALGHDLGFVRQWLKGQYPGAFEKTTDPKLMVIIFTKVDEYRRYVERPERGRVWDFKRKSWHG